MKNVAIVIACLSIAACASMTGVPAGSSPVRIEWEFAVAPQPIQRISLDARSFQCDAPARGAGGLYSRKPYSLSEFNRRAQALLHTRLFMEAPLEVECDPQHDPCLSFSILMDDGTIITRSVLSSATGDYPLLAKWLEDVREEARAAGWAKDWPPAEKKDPGD